MPSRSFERNFFGPIADLADAVAEAIDAGLSPKAAAGIVRNRLPLSPTRKDVEAVSGTLNQLTLEILVLRGRA